MIVTVDSNVPFLPELVASNMRIPASAWCTKQDVCMSPFVDISKQKRVLYNTPIALSVDTSILQYNLMNVTYAFIYLDFGQYPGELKKILNNLDILRKNGSDFYKRIVVLSNGDVYEYGQYALSLNNATKQHVSEILAMIMRLHSRYGRTIQQNEILGALCSQKMSHNVLLSEAKKSASIVGVTQSPIAHYDVMALIKAKDGDFVSYDDCTQIVCERR